MRSFGPACRIQLAPSIHLPHALTWGPSADRDPWLWSNGPLASVALRYDGKASLAEVLRLAVADTPASPPGISNTAPDQTATGKEHFEVLDGLRGTAAMLVVLFHIQGITVMWDASKVILHHAVLAVDFFFLLSGFVIGYAYDDRWDRMSVRHFLTLRLIRLHPLVILGVVLGRSLLAGATRTPLTGRAGVCFRNILAMSPTRCCFVACPPARCWRSRSQVGSALSPAGSDLAVWIRVRAGIACGWHPSGCASRSSWGFGFSAYDADCRSSALANCR
jgi:hypothetical protein